MKFYLSSIIAAAGLFFATEAKAQMPMNSMMYGRAGYGRPGYSNTMGGMDRSIGMSQYNNGKKKTDPNEKLNELERSVNHLETELSLDTFQKTVIKDLMEKDQTEETKIWKDEIPDESKYEKITILRKKLDDDINKMLSPEQQEKFKKMNEKLKKKS